MYRKKGRGWTKHIDFMLLDVLCMQIAFIVSYIWRFGPVAVLPAQQFVLKMQLL